jgi:mRNA interferase YafQ
MWNLVYTTKFKKDIKRYKNQATKIAALRTVLNQLQEKGTVDASFKPHLLSGEYKGLMECHIQNDFLLIWVDTAKNTIALIRLGTHSELFK